MVADALATAITVLGPEQGFRLALEEKLAIYLITRENNRFKEMMTPQFNNFLYDKGADHQ
jgi:thiamine biosynthesis lipoprotein